MPASSPDGPGLAVSVRAVAGDEWAVLRDIRLAALSEAPYGFTPTGGRQPLPPDPALSEIQLRRAL